MSTEQNPYATRVSEGPEDSPETPLSGESVDFVPIMRRWERLRVAYNAILVGLVLFLSLAVFPNNASEPGYWLAVVIGGLVANLCFFTGPALEAYGTRFRLWHPLVTILLFLAGLGFTALLAIASVASFQGPIGF